MARVVATSSGVSEMGVETVPVARVVATSSGVSGMEVEIVTCPLVLVWGLGYSGLQSPGSELGSPESLGRH